MSNAIPDEHAAILRAYETRIVHYDECASTIPANVRLMSDGWQMLSQDDGVQVWVRLREGAKMTAPRVWAWNDVPEPDIDQQVVIDFRHMVWVGGASWRVRAEVDGHSARVTRVRRAGGIHDDSFFRECDNYIAALDTIPPLLQRIPEMVALASAKSEES